MAIKTKKFIYKLRLLKYTMVSKQIMIDEKLKRRLDNLKIHKRETYGDIIERMIENATDKHYRTKAK